MYFINSFNLSVIQYTFSLSSHCVITQTSSDWKSVSYKLVPLSRTVNTESEEVANRGRIDQVPRLTGVWSNFHREALHFTHKFASTERIFLFSHMTHNAVMHFSTNRVRDQTPRLCMIVGRYLSEIVKRKSF